MSHANKKYSAVKTTANKDTRSPSSRDLTSSKDNDVLLSKFLEGARMIAVRDKEGIKKLAKL